MVMKKLNFEETRITRYRGVRDTAGTVVSVSAVFSAIQHGGYFGDAQSLAHWTARLRSMSTDDYKNAKTGLPAVTFSGEFTKRDSACLKMHSGLVILDFDGIPIADLPALRAAIWEYPFVAAVFISPSGAGLKAVCAVSPSPADATEHKACYPQVEAAVHALSVRFGGLDTGGSDAPRLCFLCHDSDLRVRSEVSPLSWAMPVSDEQAAEQLRAQKAKRRAFAKATGAISEDCPLETFHREDVRGLLERHGFSFLRSVGGQDEYNFHESGPGRSCTVENGVLKPFSHSLVCATPDGRPEPVNVHRLVLFLRYQMDLKGIAGPDMDALKKRLAEDGWGTYQPPTEKQKWGRRAILTKISDAEITETSLSKVRAAMDADLRAWLSQQRGAKPHILILQQDTGAGKTTACIAEIDSLMHVSTHRALAEETCASAAARGHDVLLWRARDYGRDAALAVIGLSREDPMDEETRERYTEACFEILEDGQARAMCAYPDKAEQLIERGHNLGEALCGVCHLAARCPYLRQVNEAKIAKQIFVCMPDWLTDLQYQGFIEPLQGDDRVGILDDVCPSRIPSRRQVTYRQVLAMLAQRAVRLQDHWGEVHFQESPAAAFLSNFKRILEVPALSSQSIKTALEAAGGKEIVEELSEVPAYVEVSGKHIYSAFLRDGARVRMGLTAQKIVLMELEATRVEDLQPGIHRFWVSPRVALKAGFYTWDDLPSVVNGEHGWCKAMLDDAALVRRIETETREPAVDIVVEANLNLQKMVILSATTDADEWRAVLPENTDITFRGGDARLAWEQGTKVYQLNRAKYTDASFFTIDAGEVSGPGPRLGDAAKIIAKAVRAGLRSVIFGRSKMEDLLRAALVEELGGDPPDCEFFNYAEIIGRNDFSDRDAAFAFLPSPSPEAVKARAAARYRMDFHHLDFETREDGQVNVQGAVLETRVYSDAKVQAVCQAMIDEDLRQALARLRMQLVGNKLLFLFTAWPVSGITERAIGISFEDALAAADLRNIEPILSIEDRAARGDSVKKIAADVGITTQAVYKRIPKKRLTAAEKRARDERIRAGAAIGMTMEAIAVEEGISKKTVQRVLKNG